MDRLACMATFVRVVEKGSFAAAADGSGLTAAMIGNHVRFLEDRLGSRLINRTTRRQSLTESGRDYYERCRHILAEIDMAEQHALGTASKPRGTLRATAPMAMGVRLLPRLLVEYLARHPEVDVELALNDRVVNLLDEGFEVAIRVGEIVDTTLQARPLRRFQTVLCASPAYLERHGTPHSPADLEGHSCLDFTLSGHRGSWRFSGGASTDVRGRLRVNNGQALLTAALDGLGIVNLPDLLVAQDIEAGRLVCLLDDHAPPGRPLHILTLADRKLTPKVRSFVDFITERMT